VEISGLEGEEEDEVVHIITPSVGRDVEVVVVEDADAVIDQDHRQQLLANDSSPTPPSTSTRTSSATSTAAAASLRARSSGLSEIQLLQAKSRIRDAKVADNALIDDCQSHVLISMFEFLVQRHWRLI
jgi:hypothetical protein